MKVYVSCHRIRQSFGERLSTSGMSCMREKGGLGVMHNLHKETKQNERNRQIERKKGVS